MAGISERNISKLFGLAAGRCSMCRLEIVQRDVKIGEMAHIIARSRGGARGELPFAGDINGYDNLILLCPNHHTEVDDNKEAFSPERLHQIKDDHEAYVRQVFAHKTQGRVMDLGGLQAFMQFFPFTQLVAITDGLPERFNHRLFYLDEVFDNFAKDNVHCRPFSDPTLEQFYSSFRQCISELVKYGEYAVIKGKSVYLPGALINASFNFSYLNRGLDQDERRKAHQQVQSLLNALATAYYALLDYLRRTYPEINFASFVGW